MRRPRARRRRLIARRRLAIVGQQQVLHAVRCRVTVDAGVGGYRRRDVGGRGRWPFGAGRQARFGVDDFSGSGDLLQDDVRRDGQVVEVRGAQTGAGVFRAQLPGFGRGDVRDGADGVAEEVHRVGEVVDDEAAHGSGGVGVIDVVAVGECGGRGVQDVLHIHPVVDQNLRDGGQPLNLFGGLVPGSGDEALHLTDGHRQVRQRRI